MTVRVIVPPEPIVMPADIPGDHDADDGRIAAMIAAAQADIDGPPGWLRRALGVQTLELVEDTCVRRTPLPFPPVIEVISASLRGELVDVSGWRPGDNIFEWPDGTYSGEARIRYRAGYDGRPADDGGTGKVDERARHAIILMVRHILEMTDHDVFQTMESIVGVGSTQRSVTPYVSQAVRDAVSNLLSGLVVYR